MADLQAILVALGSNIEPERHLPAAVDLLAASPQVVVAAGSSIYQSPAVGAPGSPPFLNAVVRLRTSLGPRMLKFGVLRPIERRLGRRRVRDRNAPRSIDLDLVLYDDRTVTAPDLTLPDPDLWRLAHVAVPAAEVAGDLRPPGPGTTLDSLAAALDHALARRDDLTLLRSQS